MICDFKKGELVNDNLETKFGRLSLVGKSLHWHTLMQVYIFILFDEDHWVYTILTKPKTVAGACAATPFLLPSTAIITIDLAG